MRIRILGSAAGGGVPQWNCRCPNCEAARAGSPDVRPRTQSSVAVSADQRWWFLLNVSPDVRQQILAFPELGPPAEQRRGTGIAGCVLTDAEIDHTAGLLLLREGSPFGITCTPLVRRWLNQYLRVEPILACFAKPSWTELAVGVAQDLVLPDGTASGLRVRAFEVGRDVPRFVSEDPREAAGSIIGLHIEDLQTGGRLVYAPCVVSVKTSLLDVVERADCLLMDGTFWSDDEPIQAGVGTRTASEMGHVPVSGWCGSLAWLSRWPIRERVYVHINNTNPMLNERGPEHRLVTDHGLRVGSDGDIFDV
jgi:pyrroloquinoline quinone biosynthesis protein B